jgi:hypothetical protein
MALIFFVVFSAFEFSWQEEDGPNLLPQSSEVTKDHEKSFWWFIELNRFLHRQTYASHN